MGRMVKCAFTGKLQTLHIFIKLEDNGLKILKGSQSH